MGGIIITPTDFDDPEVDSITGTVNQVIADQPTGDVTLSLPQDIAVTSIPEFAGVKLDGASSGSITLEANDSTTDYTRKWPADQGSDGQVLTTHGSTEEMTWEDSGGGGNPVLYQSKDQPGNVDTDPTELYSYLVPANTLSQDGDRLKGRFDFELNAFNGGNITFYYNGVIVLDTGSIPALDGDRGTCSVEFMITRDANDHILTSALWGLGGANLGSYLVQNSYINGASSQDAGQDNLFSIVATAGESNKIIGKGGFIEKITAP